jgi:hypothetical protein
MNNDKLAKKSFRRLGAFFEGPNVHFAKKPLVKNALLQ